MAIDNDNPNNGTYSSGYTSYAITGAAPNDILSGLKSYDRSNEGGSGHDVLDGGTCDRVIFHPLEPAYRLAGRMPRQQRQAEPRVVSHRMVARGLSRDSAVQRPKRHRRSVR